MISIIIPTLNEEKIIEKTLKDLQSRLTLSHELIVSDGKSSDRTVVIVKEFTNKVIEYSGAEGQTIAQARNEGAKIATGDFLVFMDADCTIRNPDEFFSAALARFEKNEKLVGLTASLRVLPEFETRADRFVFGLLNYNIRIMNNVFHVGEAAGEFQMIRRKAFEAVHGFREDLIASEDMDLFFRLSKIGQTMSDASLTVFHTGRRAHTVGWLRLLSTWILNTVSMVVFGKAVSKKWKPIR